MSSGREELHGLNRSSWDQLAAAHGQDSYYDTDALLAGASSLIEEEESALASAVGSEVAGLRILHVQCHIGFDSITFARRGARVTGVDFSPVALAKARDLASRAGVEIEWCEADACELPAELAGRFDLAWATIGVLCWIADLDGWMTSVARALAPGGQLALIDRHPLMNAVAQSEPLRLWGAYGGGGAEHFPEGGDYATSTTTGPQVQFSYSLGEIVSAAARAGLVVEELIEHMQTSSQLGMHIDADSDGYFRMQFDGHLLPMLFTLRARRHAP